MGFDVTTFEKLTEQCRNQVAYHRILESTNDEAKKEILAGSASSGAIYIAEFQTGGRGRGKNRWVCPEGEGLLFSLVLDPDVEPRLWYRMSLAVGLAIVESVTELGLDVTLKWPNDIYKDDKKLGGILIEQVNDMLIAGVGLNVSVSEFPDEVAEKAESLSNVIENTVNRELLLSRMVHSIYRKGSLIGADFGRIVEQVEQCFYLTNKQVAMMVNGDSVEGKVLGISPNGYLLLEDDEGTEKMIEIHDAQEINIINKY